MAGRPAILKVDIIADAKGVGRGVDQAESRFSKLGATMGKVGKLAATGLAVGLGAAAAGAVMLAKGAAEDEKSAARLAKSLQNTTGATDRQVAATERWISKQGVALGVADDELRPALEKLAGSTGSVQKAQEQAALAMDVAAGRGISLEQVTKALEKANNGQVTGLSRLGVATTDAAGKTLTLDQITANMAKTYSGQAATAADTAAGRYGRLKLQMGELGESIGGKLLPVGNKLAGWALGMLPKVTKLGESIGSKLAPVLSTVGRFIRTRVVPAASALHHWFVDKIVPGIRNYVSPILDGLRAMFAKVADKIGENGPQLRKIGDALKTVAEFVAAHVLPILGKLAGKGFQAVGLAIGVVIDTIGLLVDWIDKAVGKIGDLVDWIGKIDMPNIDIPFVGGSVGDLLTVRYQLAGDSPNLDNRRAWTSAALTPASWASVASNATALAAGTTVLVDARTTLEVDNRASLADELTLARKLEAVLARHSQRMGRTALVTP